MLTIMNQGTTDVPTDLFYTTARQSSIFQRARMRKAKTVSYTADGRLLLDGQPAAPDTPEEQWHDLIIRAITYRLLRSMEKAYVPKAKWTKKVQKSASLKEPMRLYQYDKSGESKVENVYITTIRIQEFKSELQRRATR